MKYLAFALLLCLTSLTSLAHTDTTSSVTRPYALYGLACQDALQYNLPLVVGINVSPPASYWCSCQVSSLPGFQSGTVVLFLPKNGSLLTASVLGATASVNDIQNAVNRGLPTTTLVNTSTETEETPATLCVCVPADAVLKLDGHPTSPTGTRRTFRTPPLAVGSTYSYSIYVALDGWKCEKTLTFKAGDNLRLCFPGLDCRAPGCQCGPDCACPNCPGNGCVNSNNTPAYGNFSQPLQGFQTFQGGMQCGPNGCGVSQPMFQPMMQPMFFGGRFGGGGCASGNCR